MDMYNHLAPHQPDETLHGLFEKQAAQRPDEVALVFQEQQVSYRELQRRSDQVAGFLIERGVKPGELVGLMLERSVEQVVALLGILKAGAAYVPLDPAYPMERKRIILQESACRVLIANPAHIQGELATVQLVDVNSAAVMNGRAKPAVPSTGADLAYVIYSSGTTGQPKGIMVEHGSLINLLRYYNRRYCINQDTRILQVTNLVIDIALQEIFSSLINGLTLYIPTQEMIFDREALRGFIATNQISFVQVIPDTLREYFLEGERLESVTTLLCGGDKLPGELQDAIVAKGYPLYNVYGQTETTIDALVSQCTTGVQGFDEVVDNCQVYVLDDQMQPVPVGVAGEICVGGVGVARGYWQQPALTQEKFIENPFAEGRLYKTGDRGVITWEGRLEFRGRQDEQVKIRGYRIELGEIEKALLGHPQVREVVVVAQGEAEEEKYLCAYYTLPLADAGGRPSEELREYLQGQLPGYMVPSYLVELPQLPVNANGKIDRRALPLPDKTQRSKEFVAPRNEIEQQLVEVWEDVLKVAPIGLNDNFFEIGGDSIKGIQVVARLHQQGFKLSVAHLMQFPRLREAALQVQPLTIALDQGLVQGDVKLTPVQQWFFDFRFTDPHHFSMAWMLHRPEGLDEQHVRQVLEALALHHDALRMVYRPEQDQVRQHNRGRESAPYDLRVVTVQGAEDEGRAIEQAGTQQHASMDLAAGPLLKAGLFRASDGDHLLLSIHHLIMDGVSWRIVLEDFATAYQQLQQGQAIRLPPKTSSFQQWAAAVHGYAHSPQLQEEVAYWQQVEQDLQALTPPGQAVGTTADLALEWISLSEPQTRRLQHEVHQAYGTQMNDVLLTALALALWEWTGQDKHIIMLEGHGREEVVPGVDVNRTVGWFTAHFLQPLNVKFPHDLSYQLRSIKEQVRQVPHKGIGYEIWRHLLSREHPAERPYPLVDFNYLGEFNESDVAAGLQPSPYSVGITTSPASELVTDIELVGSIRAGKLTLRCHYNSKRFEQASVAHLLERLREQLSNLIDHCMNQMQPALTPSDFSANDLSLDDLALLQGQFSNF
ncbi:amino acid adenylation domain-containing protein [Hymenobacter sp. BT664]|uniref:Amino acid adenylation domain-containing protein n=1 Tax=Hymenobacter montanus TaxID=2771359 RepID=A0A927BBP2_9BACT|nr:non-ribosomal peptide synthetase [Hymenobacter montanus]MBD2767189.1 amino acid adenylation domain-containing protein [Hymenobacter montanus]